MSIPLVIQTYDEVRRLAIAGSVVAAGDFRLKKLVDPLKKSAEKAPVFGKVADGIEKLVNAPEKDTGPVLLELGTLVNAILYTQGETGAAGEIADLPSVDMGVQTSSQASARVLKPLMESLTTTGSGRHEIITEAHKRNAFRDLRMVNLAIRGLDDVYAEIADFMAKEVLPIYGNAIIPELRAGMKFPGKHGDARRLKLLYRLDPQGARDLVEQAFAEGSKELKVAALECLGDSKKDLPHLFEQAEAKAKEVRIAAFIGLGKVHDEQAVVDLFKKALTGKEPEIAITPASRNRNANLLAFLLAEARAQLAGLFATTDKGKLKTQLMRFGTFLATFDFRDEGDTEAFLLECFNQREKLLTVKGEPMSGSDVNQLIARMMATSKSPRLHEALIAVGIAMPVDTLEYAFLAACRALTPERVFDMYWPLLKVKLPEKGKKSKDPAALRAEALKGCLLAAGTDYSTYRWGRYGGHHVHESDAATGINATRLNARWLDAAVAAGDVELTSKFARAGHAGCAKFLVETLKARLASKSDTYDYADLIETLVTIEHPEATDCWIAGMQKATAKKTTSYYGTYWLAAQVAKMPAESIAKVEAMLPTLPERVIDEVLPHLQALKEKARAAEK